MQKYTIDEICEMLKTVEKLTALTKTQKTAEKPKRAYNKRKKAVNE